MRRHLHIAFAALLLVGLLVCTRPGEAPVDPGALLRNALDRDPSASVSPRIRALIERNYDPSVTGEDTIAGHKAWVLRLSPKIEKRPFRQLWIDQKTHAVLAMRDWTSANRLKRALDGPSHLDGPGYVSRTRFRGHLPHQDAVFRRGTKVPGIASWMNIQDDQVITNIQDDRAVPRYVPNGFELIDVRVIPRGGWSRIVYSDGLYALSVFQRFPSRPGREHNRTVHEWAGGFLLSTTRSGREVVIVGDLPKETLGKIAESIP